MTRLSDVARERLAGYYRRKDIADRELAAYVQGILDALGISLDRYVGFDDITGELIVNIEPEPPPAASRSRKPKPKPSAPTASTMVEPVRSDEVTSLKRQ